MIIDKDPTITGDIMYSRDTSANNAIKGFAAAGGWITLKYIIKEIVNPTASPSEI